MGVRQGRLVLARYRYRIEPDLVQRGKMARTFGCARVVFNDVIRCRDEAYRSGVTLTSTEVQRRVITAAKTRESREWWSRDLPSEPSSVTIIREPDGKPSGTIGL